MTIGQRIAQKRKELGLSQEALGDRLGVSRQSIYKWESDAALPEIEKLVALSGLFGVSVGWLLGVEEDAAPDTPENDGELTETQLKMIEEIVDRYTAALPKPKKSAWDKWSVRFLFAVCGLMVGCLVSISGNVKQLGSQYSSLQNNVAQVQNSVDRQIGTITNRVEEILKSQNDLTADYGTEIVRVDLETDSITFSLRAVPKTFVEGMMAEFTVDNGEDLISQRAELRPGGEFGADDATAVLSDSIVLSVVFIYPDGTRQTQLLETYEYLYSQTLPEVSVQDDFAFLHVTMPEPQPPYSSYFEPPAVELTENAHERYLWTQNVSFVDAVSGMGPTAIGNVRVGLFKNQKLVAWAEPCGKPESYRGFEDCSFYQLPVLKVPLLHDDVLQAAAVVTDEYGRVTVCPGTPYSVDSADGTLTNPTYSAWDTDPENWAF